MVEVLLDEGDALPRTLLVVESGLHGIKSPFLGPSSALALAEILRRVVKIKAIARDHLLPL